MTMFRFFFKQTKTIVLAIAMVLVISGQSQSLADDHTLENKIKVAYLYNVLKFVWWPENVLAADKSEIKICLLGQNQFGPYLNSITQMTAQGRNITITAISNVSQASDCHLLVISASKANHLAQIMDRLKDTPCLTVSEVENFAAKGGMIGFALKKGKVVLEINTQATKKANLEISAKLLEVANIIK